jgi:hypothetical protein
MLIDVDPGNKTIVWRGWGRADVNLTPKQTEQLIQKITVEILSNFPNQS